LLACFFVTLRVRAGWAARAGAASGESSDIEGRAAQSGRRRLLERLSKQRGEVASVGFLSRNGAAALRGITASYPYVHNRAGLCAQRRL
jgi:hypothetical protein